MRVLVAGATGAVGRLLVPMLVAAGHEATGTSRTPAGVERIRSLGATGVRVDALDAERLRKPGRPKHLTASGSQRGGWDGSGGIRGERL
ncbi:NAD(P)H-binding protein, partial [Streptomyces sp. NPDC002920]